MAGECADAPTDDVLTEPWLVFVDGTVVAGTDGLGLEELRRFWETSPELLAVLDHDGGLIAGNTAWAVRLGWSTAALRGRRLVELTHPDDHPAVELALDRLRGSATTIEVDLRLRSAKGRELHVRAMLSSVADGVGGGVTIYLTAHDVTEQRRAEAALAATSEQLQRAMEAAPIGMVLADLEGRAQVVNEAMCRLLGRSRDEVVGLRLDEAAAPQDRTVAREHLTRMVSGGDVHRFELRFVGGGDDRVVRGEVTACVVLDVDGQPAYLLGQIVDITDRHAVETRLRTAVTDLEDSNRRLARANEMLEHFAATASHDLRGPLGTVLTTLETVLLRPAAPLHERDRDLLDRAQRHTDRLVETIDALLTLARRPGEHGDMQPVDLGDLVDEVLDALEPELRRTDAQVDAVDLPTIVGDPAMLRVLLQNLLGNAIKFAHPDREPSVQVTAQRAGDLWEVSVTDNGIGLSADEAERIFERYARAGETGTRPGSGLGLATCRQIAEAHGGDIRAEPLPVGSRFVVRLPTTGYGPS